jgi:hypothetical protein
MPDLKLDVEAATAALGKQLDYGIENLRQTAERLIDDIKTIVAVQQNPTKLNINDADAAILIDFFNNYDGTDGQITLQLPGGTGGYARLAKGLPRGKYRAVILINKIDGEPAQ